MRTARLRITWLTSSMMLGLAIGAAQAAPNGPNVSPNIVMPNVPPGNIAPIRPDITVHVPTHVYDDTPHERKVRRKVRRSLKETGATTTEHKVHRRKARRTVKLPGLAPKHTQPAHVGEPVRDAGRDKGGLIAPANATIVPLPAVHPLPNADLVNKANQGRDGETVRDAGEALRNNGIISPGKGVDRGVLGGDPLHNSDADKDTNAALATVNAIRARFGLAPLGKDGSRLWGLPGGLGQSTGQRHQTAPGVVPDPNHLPTVSATDKEGDGEEHEDADGMIRTSSTRTDGQGNTTTVLKVTDSSNGDVTIVKSTAQAGGVYTYDVLSPNGDSHTHIELSSGASRDIHTFSSGVQYVHGYDRYGRESESRFVYPPNDLTRLTTGDENKGSNGCASPSGWGCAGPLNADQLKGDGSRGRPSDDDNASNSPGTGPTIDARHSIAVNPDTNATGGGGTPTSARTFDGGKLVNPGPEPSPSVVPPR
jgi:hypothetical protein